MKKKILVFSKDICFLLIAISFFSCLSYRKVINNQTNEYDIKMLKACELYVENYQPLYYLDGDTLEIGIFNHRPDSINNYLLQFFIKAMDRKNIEEVEENIFEPLFFSDLCEWAEKKQKKHC
jgi:hypothetical protein